MDNQREREKVVYTFTRDACSPHYVKMRQFHGEGMGNKLGKTRRSVKMMLDGGGFE